MLDLVGLHLSALRPLQWSKNLLVFAALIFARQVGVPGQFSRALFVFIAFCFISSALYLFNDIHDREEDKRHSQKRWRPIASGLIELEVATVLALSLATLGFLMARDFISPAPSCLLAYALLGILYTLYLKRVVIVDVLAVSAGFVLRAAAGGFAISVPISPWLLMCTMLLALFLTLAKRRSELDSSSRPHASRRVLGEYSVPLLDQLLAVVASATLMAYILYAFSERTAGEFPSGLMPLTIPFVLFGIFRYLYLVHGKARTAEPEQVLFRDYPLLIDIALWLAAVALVSMLR